MNRNKECMGQRGNIESIISNFNARISWLCTIKLSPVASFLQGKNRPVKYETEKRQYRDEGTGIGMGKQSYMSSGYPPNVR